MCIRDRYTKVGNNIDVVILNIDKDGRKLQLGHKQIEEDPWNSLQETFHTGTVHEGTVIKKDDKGAVVQLPYGLEGFAPSRHLAKEDGKTVGADEIAQFMVIEFDRNDKRIVLSHTRLWEQAQEQEKQVVMKEKKAESEVTKKAVKTLQSKVEKSTLGDLSALADIRAKLDGSAAAAEVKAAATPATEAPVEDIAAVAVPEATVEAKVAEVPTAEEALVEAKVSEVPVAEAKADDTAEAEEPKAE
jgi:small subunit ribosomal protein S1